jgi:sugar (pentulose or hexulose) kinase
LIFRNQNFNVEKRRQDLCPLKIFCTTSNKYNFFWKVSFIFKECQDILINNNYNFPKEIVLIGGGAKNIQWAKILSSLLNVKILVPENQDYVASIGAIRLAMNNLTMSKYKPIFPESNVIDVDLRLREILLDRFDRYIEHQKLLFNLKNC